MNTFDLIRNGLDRNILIYDATEKEKLSLRIFSLLKMIAHRNSLKINRFIIDSDCQTEINLWFPELNSLYGKPKVSNLDNLHLLGLPVIFKDGLCDYNKTPYLMYYKDLGGTLMYGYTRPGLIIAAGEDCALLGCYND